MTDIRIGLDDEWVECGYCEGYEGWYDGDDWVDCPECEGQGGWYE